MWPPTSFSISTTTYFKVPFPGRIDYATTWIVTRIEETPGSTMDKWQGQKGLPRSCTGLFQELFGWGSHAFHHCASESTDGDASGGGLSGKTLSSVHPSPRLPRPILSAPEVRNMMSSIPAGSKFGRLIALMEPASYPSLSLQTSGTTSRVVWPPTSLSNSTTTYFKVALAISKVVEKVEFKNVEYWYDIIHVCTCKYEV